MFGKLEQIGEGTSRCIMENEENQVDEFEEELVPMEANEGEEVELEQGHGGEEEDEEEEEEYAFNFDGDMNPLEFVQNDNFENQIYEQFQRHESETVVEKKRKTIAQNQQQQAKKPRLEDQYSGATFENIMEFMNYASGQRSRKKRQRWLKKRGRPNGSRSKLSPEITKKLGDATLNYVQGNYQDAIALLHEVIRVAPNIPDSYHMLGLVYKDLGDDKKAWNFYFLAANFSPRDSSLWKLLYSWSLEIGNTGRARFCLSKAISANPKDVELRSDLASLYEQLGEYQRAAKTLEQIKQISPDSVEALKKEAMLYLKCGQFERCIGVLEGYIKDCSNAREVDTSILEMLVSVLMEHKAHDKALQHIEHAQSVYLTGKGLPLSLTVEAGICNLHIGDLKKAESCFIKLENVNVTDFACLIMEVGDSCMDLEQFILALKYYKMLEGNIKGNMGLLYMKITRCYSSLNDRRQAIQYLYNSLNTLEDNLNARVTLASLLVEEGKEDDAISLLSPPKSAKPFDQNNDGPKPWWLTAKIKLKLCEIYRAKLMPEEFVDTILALLRESLYILTTRQKVEGRRKLTTKVLIERAKLLDGQQTDDVFGGFRPVATSYQRLKASRARKELQKRAMAGEGDDQLVEDSDDDERPPITAHREPPLPNLLKDDDNYRLIIDLCKALASSRRYWEALEIINLTLRLANKLPNDTREELRSLGAQMAYSTTNPKHGFDCVRYIVQQHPHSTAAWNCYYKVVSKLENRDLHMKFLRDMREKYKDCVPPILIYGHQFTAISWHQVAAKAYLEAYKLLPENPFISLCAGTALINLALGHRLQNKEHLCVAQGLAFLYNYLKLCENSQEALYNVARAYHHVGMVTLAVTYYEKVLATRVKDYPIPKLPNEPSDDLEESRKPGYCDLRREAAFNLHLIYMKSGAIDLARQGKRCILSILNSRSCSTRIFQFANPRCICLLCILDIHLPDNCDTAVCLLLEYRSIYVVAGLPSNLDFLLKLANHWAFARGDVETHFIEHYQDELFVDPNNLDVAHKAYNDARLGATLVVACLCKKELSGLKENFSRGNNFLSIWYSGTPYRFHQSF